MHCFQYLFLVSKEESDTQEVVLHLMVIAYVYLSTKYGRYFVWTTFWLQSGHTH